jgi:mannose-6-phosphate isomerase-like protein (cupin superfamily)
MNNFPNFMKNPKNAIDSSSQSKGVNGYIYDGADGGQMAFWECHIDGKSHEHVHNFDEYFVVVQGQYTLILNSQKILLKPGYEYFIPMGTTHAGEFIAGTRTIHAFGGRRAERAATDR